MPDPNKKISSPTLDSCDRNVACTVEREAPASAGISKPNPEEKITSQEKHTSKECMNPCLKKPKDDTASAKLANKLKKTSAKETKNDTAPKPEKECKKIVEEKQAVLNKEPCPPGPTCEMARPDSTNAKARVNKTKPGCMDFESCEDEEENDQEEVAKVEKQASGCINYEDCKDLANEEKRKLKEQKNSEKQKKKEKPQKGKENPCPKK